MIVDLVRDVSASEFIGSLTRFVARRGCPKMVLSDNGGAFEATETQQFAAAKNIKWKFSLAKAPWFGGFWERLVQSVKRCLKRVIGRTILDFVDLQTVFLKVEHVLNSRPLGTLFDDDLEQHLTPNHLLYGRSLPKENTINGYISDEIITQITSKRVKHIETIIQHFWNRWRREYLESLRSFKQTKMKV